MKANQVYVVSHWKGDSQSVSLAVAKNVPKVLQSADFKEFGEESVEDGANESWDVWPLKSIINHYSAVDGDFSKRFGRPESALADIDARVGLESDGGVDEYGCLRFAGVELRIGYSLSKPLHLRALKAFKR